MWWKESNSYKQVRPHHTVRGLQVHPHLSCIPSPLWPVEMWGKILMLIFLPVWIRTALMNCTPWRDCQTFLCLFTKPTFNKGGKNVTVDFMSKTNTKGLLVHVLSVQVKSSVFSESCSERCSGPINFTVTHQVRRVKSVKWKYRAV